MYTDADKKMMMATVRTAGAVGTNAILPRILKTMIEKDWAVLDYGSGPKAIQTMALRDEGYNVVAHDVNPEKTMWHIDTRMNSYQEQFDVIFASNVLNIQPADVCVDDVAREVCHMLRHYSFALFNYPTSPRKVDLTVAEIDGILKDNFQDVERIRQINNWKISTPVWKCKKGG